MEMPEGWKDLDQINSDFHTGRFIRIEEALDLMKELAEQVYQLAKIHNSSDEMHEGLRILKKFKEWK